MPIKSILILLLAFLTVSSSKTCFGEDCQFETPQLTPQERNSPKTIAKAMASQLQRSYWYYLRNGKPLYSAYVQTQTRYIYFFYHLSPIGTFFTIASYYTTLEQAKINTMVRLDSGLGGKVTRDSEQDILSLYFRNDLSKRITELVSQQADIDFSGEITEISIGGGDSQQITRDKCRDQSDNYLRKTYWYYLRGATIIENESLIKNSRRYHLFTYMNHLGTFFVITSCQNEQVKANTFVRIGRGGQPKKVVPVG